MPIFEYKCKQCGKDFERLVFPGEEKGVSCPECKNKDVTTHLPKKLYPGLNHIF
jgi:putative FmdB family regulatory protein